MPESSTFYLSTNWGSLRDRQQAVVEFFEQDADNVQKNLVTVRAELRVAFTVLGPGGVIHGDLTL